MGGAQSKEVFYDDVVAGRVDAVMKSLSGLTEQQVKELVEGHVRRHHQPGHSPLHAAASHGRDNVLKYLIGLPRISLDTLDEVRNRPAPGAPVLMDGSTSGRGDTTALRSASRKSKGDRAAHRSWCRS